MPVTDEPHSARKKECEQRSRRRRKGSGIGESRGHVNRYMLETHRVFIHVFMHRLMVKLVVRGIWLLTVPEF